MKPPERMLILDDDSLYAELLKATLSAQWPGCSYVIVATEKDFSSALRQGGFDLIISDYVMPGFSGPAALALARKECPDTPFLFVSGAIGDEVAVESLKAGATDYVLKDRGVKLIPAIQRALGEVEESNRRKQAEERYRDLFENASDLIQSVTPEGRFLYVNRAWKETLGYTDADIASMSIFDVLFPRYHPEWRARFQQARPHTTSGPWEATFVTRHGRHLYVEGNLSGHFECGKLIATREIFHDVTERKIAAITLKRAFRKFEALVNSVDGIVWQAQLPALRFSFVSQQAERLLGHPPRRWLDEAGFWQAHLHPDDRERVVSAVRQLTLEQGHLNLEYRMIAADGRIVWLRDALSVRLENSRALQVQGIMVDITEQRRAETARQESEMLKGAIMEAALDCIIVMDHEGRILEFNPAAEKTFGYSRSDVLGRPLAEKIIPPSLRHRYDEGLKRCQATGQGPVLGRRVEITAMRADGSEFPVELAIIPIRSGGGGPIFTAYLRDITERKRTEDKIAKVQAELKETNGNLLRRNQEIQNFYHTLSHELKTPLTSAREFISIVMEGIPGKLNATQTEYLDIARQSCDQLRVCINDLLDATRLETGKLTLEIKPTSLAVLVQRATTAFSRMAAEKQIVLTSDVQSDLPGISLDEYRITQVITNLLNNALKYTRSGGKIHVRVGQAPGQPQLVEVSVTDTGCGIARDEQDHIFERLYQVKSGDATTEQGIGLGLYLCRELVQLHGGSISVASKPGLGSTFSFVLPVNEQAFCCNLLIIDDDLKLLEILSQFLTREQYNVRTARDGVEGLEEMRRQAADVVLMDLVMPRLDGPATLREIRKHWSSVPIIVHTGHANSELMKQALSFSPFTLLAKPSRPEQILETVRKVQRTADTIIWTRNHFGLRRPPGK